jgi:hypothetical protein
LDWLPCSKYHIVHVAVHNIFSGRPLGHCHDVVLCRMSKYQIVTRAILIP